MTIIFNSFVFFVFCLFIAEKYLFRKLCGISDTNVHKLLYGKSEYKKITNTNDNGDDDEHAAGD